MIGDIDEHCNISHMETFTRKTEKRTHIHSTVSHYELNGNNDFCITKINSLTLLNFYDNHSCYLNQSYHKILIKMRASEARPTRKKHVPSFCIASFFLIAVTNYYPSKMLHETVFVLI